MTLSEKSAYLKGLMDGLKLDTDKNEGKLIAAIIDMLDLRRPIYKQLSSYGHLGREDLGVTWEKTDRAELLKKTVESL